MATPSSDQLKQVVVIGAGVVGLTTAIKIQEKGGYQVAIIAEVLPTDPKTIKYTSHWAGAHHVSMAEEGDIKQLKMDQETFDVMWDYSAPGAPTEGCFMRIVQTDYHCNKGRDEHFLEFMPNFKRLAASEFKGEETVDGMSFNTVTIETPVYLNYLLSRFLARGGSVTRGSVQHINQIVEGGANTFNRPRAAAKPDAIIVCTGLGTRTLGGVEDKNVYPIRGQTVLLRAPWVKSGRSRTTKGDVLTYIIPRRSGEVIVGGTKIGNDWYPNPRPEITRDILQRTFALFPELAPPEIRAQREATYEDLYPIIIEEGCGLRPGRKGGIRLEVEWFETEDKKSRVPVVYNYGHGGYGFQSSWGSASIAVTLLEDALAKV